MSPGKLWKKHKGRALPVETGASAAAPIPELKKKEEEKKGGAVWLSSGAGSPGVLVRGAGSIASGGPSGLLGSARIAQVLANSFGRASWIGGLFASPMGPLLVLGGMLSPALFIVGALAVSRPGLTARDAATSSAPVTTFIPAANSALTAATLPADPLSLAAKANKGFYEPGQAPEAADAPAETPASEGTPDAPPAPQAPDISALLGQQETKNAKGLNPDGFIQKMTSDRSSPGGLPAGAKLKDSGIQMQMAGGGFSKPIASRGGKVQAFARQPRPLTLKKISTRRGRAARAMGQLKLADNLSQAGANNVGETARQYSADAFDQQRSAGVGTGEAGVSPDPNSVVPTGTATGAPDVTDIAPPVQGENATPYQDKVDDAKKKTNMAMMLMIMGGMLIAAGMLLTVMGMMKMQAGQMKIQIGQMMISIGSAIPFGLGAGIVAAGQAMVTAGTALVTEGQQMLMIGMGMIAAGGGMLAAGLMMAMAAKGQGDAIDKNYGQKDQGQVIDECADQAVNKENCRPSTVNQPGNTIQEDVAAERNATYSLDNGEPVK
ncbi:MAG TPA: hypothetical protein DCM05_00790 [Elusimicrobia bacterium]|nr:hypothetical protein [Elusimicrobiota bacterium]